MSQSSVSGYCLTYLGILKSPLALFAPVYLHSICWLSIIFEDEDDNEKPKPIAATDHELPWLKDISDGWVPPHMHLRRHLDLRIELQVEWLIWTWKWPCWQVNLYNYDQRDWVAPSLLDFGHLVIDLIQGMEDERDGYPRIRTIKTSCTIASLSWKWCKIREPGPKKGRKNLGVQSGMDLEILWPVMGAGSIAYGRISGVLLDVIWETHNRLVLIYR